MRVIPSTFFVLLLLAMPAVAQTLERIRESGALTFGFREDARPLSYATHEGLASGYSPALCVRLVQPIADHLGLESLSASFVPVTAENRFEKVANGEVDILCGAATITLSRRAMVDFSVPTYVDGTALILPGDAPEELASLAGKKIGVRRGTTTEEGLRNTLENVGMDAQTMPFASHDEGFAALQSGDIDAYFADQSILLFLRAEKGQGQNLKVSDQVLTLEKQGLAFARGDDELRLLIDTELAKMFRAGVVEDIFRTHMAGAEPGAGLRAMFLLSPTLP